MTTPRFELHSSLTDRALLADATRDAGTRSGRNRIGLTGLLAEPARLAFRARRVRAPGAAVATAYRWRLRDHWDTSWWPQGIAVGQHNGIPLAITSWFAQKKKGHSMGSRISVVDLRDARRPRYHHVLLVAPKRVGSATAFEPVEVHAGGIAWSGDRLLVAATFGGFREFDLRDILRAPSAGTLRRSSGLFGYRYLLPESGRFSPPKAPKDQRLRYSFVSIDVDRPAQPQSESRVEDNSGHGPGTVHLVTGEYTKDSAGKLARLSLTHGRTVIDDTRAPGIPEMQGAVVIDDTWFVNASRGDKLGGDLWVGTPGAMTRHEHVLPPGPEDIAAWPERGQVWSVTEFPGKRWIYGVDTTRWMPKSR